MTCINDVIPLTTKDPDDVLDFGNDYTDFMRPLGDAVTIADSTWSQTSGDDVLTLTLPVISAKKTKIRVAGGTVGNTNRITNRITLSDGQIKEASIDIEIVQK